MSFDILLLLSEILDVSTDYILTGKIGAEDNIEFLEQYKQLSCKQRQYINEHMKLFLKSNLKWAARRLLFLMGEMFVRLLLL